jgi:CPA2 family monovalent cation:H+ antiporter-2
MDQTIPEASRIFLELGVCIVGLAILARLASRWGFSSISLYLMAGLAFGNSGLAPLNLSKGFIQLGAEVGVLLLLFMLGLEYSGEQLKESLSRGLPAGVADFVLNFPPGLATGILLGWNFMAAVLLGGVTWISSSGLIAKVFDGAESSPGARDAGGAVDLGTRGSGDGGIFAAERGPPGGRRAS